MRNPGLPKLALIYIYRETEYFSAYIINGILTTKNLTLAYTLMLINYIQQNRGLHEKSRVDISLKQDKALSVK